MTEIQTVALLDEDISVTCTGHSRADGAGFESRLRIHHFGLSAGSD